jgi:transcriptional regulator with XRE-family HTH domain
VSDDPYLAVIRARIKAARTARNLRQEDAAEAAGIELRNWQRLEAVNPARKFNPTLETLRAVSRITGVTVSDLTREPTLDELAALKKVGRPKRVMKPG